MTEAAHQMTSNPLPPANRKAGSVGRGTDVRVGIMDAAGHLCPPGDRGEVVIQGPNVIRGYDNNPRPMRRRSSTDGSAPATRAISTPTAISGSSPASRS
jgi:acyl-CoA synthetase (AMP-forming)/AMP-acid ligase II